MASSWKTEAWGNGSQNSIMKRGGRVGSGLFGLVGSKTGVGVAIHTTARPQAVLFGPVHNDWHVAFVIHTCLGHSRGVVAGVERLHVGRAGIHDAILLNVATISLCV